MSISSLKLSLKKAGELQNTGDPGGSAIQQGKIKIGELFSRNLGRDLAAIQRPRR
jgi:hypothetical protein